jgi:hypothetical protein
MRVTHTTNLWIRWPREKPKPAIITPDSGLISKNGTKSFHRFGFVLEAALDYLNGMMVCKLLHLTYRS